MDRCKGRTSNSLKRLTTTLLLAIVLAAILLATVTMPGYAQDFTFQGRVFEGNVGDESSLYKALPLPSMVLTSPTQLKVS